MLRRILVAVLLVTVVGTVGIAAAPKATSPPDPGMWRLADTPLARLVSGNIGRLLVLRSQLSVTPEQRAKVRNVLVEHRSEMAVTVKSVRDKRLVLRDAVLADNPDDAKIRAAAEELGTAIGDAAVKAAKLRGEVTPILTDGQLDLVRQFRQDRDESIDAFRMKTMQAE